MHLYVLASSCCIKYWLPHVNFNLVTALPGRYAVLLQLSFFLAMLSFLSHQNIKISCSRFRIYYRLFLFRWLTWKYVAYDIKTENAFNWWLQKVEIKPRVFSLSMIFKKYCNQILWKHYMKIWCNVVFALNITVTMVYFCVKSKRVAVFPWFSFCPLVEMPDQCVDHIYRWSLARWEAAESEADCWWRIGHMRWEVSAYLMLCIYCSDWW